MSKGSFCWLYGSGEGDTDIISIVSDIPGDITASAQVYIRLEMTVLASQEFVTNAARAGASGIVLAGVRNGADIQRVDMMLAVAEATHGLPAGVLKIFALPGDNPAGLLSLSSLAGKSARLVALGWDRRALALACGHPAPSDRLTDLERSARSMILLAAASCGVAAIDTPDDQPDPEHFKKLCQDARAEGFSGKIALSHEHVPIIHQVFVN